MVPSYGGLLRGAASLAVRHPGLWIFGFFVSASAGGGTGDIVRVLDREEIDLGALAPILSALLVLIVLLAVFFLIASILAEAALIHGAREIACGRPARPAALARVGLTFYWRLFALFAILLVALSAALIPMVGAPLLVWKGLGSGLVVTVLLVLALAPPYILFTLGAIFVFAWAPRVAVLDGAGPLRSIRVALRRLAREPLRAFALAFGALVNEAIALTLLCLAALPFTVVAATLYVIHPLLVILPGLPFMALLLVYFGVKGAFASAYWTLATLGTAGRSGEPDPWTGGAGGI